MRAMVPVVREMPGVLTSREVWNGRRTGEAAAGSVGWFVVARKEMLCGG